MTLIFFKRYFLWMLITLIGCQERKPDDDLPQDSINGLFLAADKGFILEFKDGQDILYNVNAVGCSIQDDNFIPDAFAGLQLNQVNENQLIGSSDLISSDIQFTRLSNQNEFCLPDQLADTSDPKVNFDHFWNIFNDYYAFFETRNIDWSQFESLGEQLTSENFYEIIGELVVSLDDGHVSIRDEENGVSIDSGAPGLLERLNQGLSGDLMIDSEEDYDILFDQRIETIIAYVEGNFEIDESENIAWGIINNDIGYINILGMQGYSSNIDNELETLNNVLDAVMNDLKNSEVSKLIIDIRFNGGGFDGVSVAIASRFVDQERLGFSKKARLGDGYTESTSVFVTPKGDFQYTDDIILLTSPITASAAEVFALCIKDLSNVTIVGENTNGIFSDILTHTLPNGTLIGLSNEIYSDAQEVVFEAIGIGPEEENNVPLFSNEEFIEGKDNGIDRAIELLNNN